VSAHKPKFCQLVVNRAGYTLQRAATCERYSTDSLKSHRQSYYMRLMAISAFALLLALKQLLVDRSQAFRCAYSKEKNSRNVSGHTHAVPSGDVLPSAIIALRSSTDRILAYRSCE
jgi:hypothetical protein